MDIAKIAKLANLNLTSQELTEFPQQLDKIVDYISQLKKVDIKNTVPTHQVSGKVNATRTDEIKPGLKLDIDYFKIPAIFENV